MTVLSYDCDGPDLEAAWGRRKDFFYYANRLQQRNDQKPRVYLWTQFNRHLDRWAGAFRDAGWEPWLTIRPLEMSPPAFEEVPNMPRLGASMIPDWRLRTSFVWLDWYVVQRLSLYAGIRIDCRTHVRDSDIGDGMYGDVRDALRTALVRIRHHATIPVEITIPPPRKTFVDMETDRLIRYVLNEPGCAYSQAYHSVWQRATVGEWSTICGGFRGTQPLGLLGPWLDHCAVFGDGAILYEAEPHMPDPRWPNKLDAIAERCVLAGNVWPRVVLYSLNTFAAPQRVDLWVAAMRAAGLAVG